MVLADPVHVEADLFGHYGFLYDLTEPLGVRDHLPGGRVGVSFGECRDSEFHREVSHSKSLLYSPMSFLAWRSPMEVHMGTCPRREE